MSSKADWSDIRKQYLAGLATKGIRMTLHDRVWGVTDDRRWVALPGVTATTDPDHWWLTYEREQFARRSAVGAILLCASRNEPLRDFGLPAGFIREIEGSLPVGRQRPLLSFNVFRRGSGFDLLLKGGRRLDITRWLGDLSWLIRPEAHGVVAESPELVERKEGRHVEQLKFFARVAKSRLEPLDPVEFGEGAVYLVSARRVDSAPGTPSLRRILAREGPPDLPADFAEQHDFYAHGSPKR